MAKKAKTIKHRREVKRGRYVSKEYAEAHPDTTVTERDKVMPKRRKRRVRHV